MLDEAIKSYSMRVKDLPEADKPREKQLTLGPQELSVAELLAIVWGTGSRREDVLAMAKRTLREYGEKAVVTERNPEHLAQAASIPLGKAHQLIASLELGRRFHATSRGGRPRQVRTPKQAYLYLRDMGTYSKEQLRGLYLNSRYHVIHDEVISVGSLTSNVVHPREVFQPAIERSAAAVIIAHNHPSGVLEPSTADLNVTRQLLAAGEVLGIDLLDHLIITPKSHASVLGYLA